MQLELIGFDEAFKKVIERIRDYGTEEVTLKKAHGRILAEDIVADRDFPPFDRATKDGIAILYEAFEQGRREFEISGVAAAGTPVQVLNDPVNCLEIMTGATVPYDSDTVVMYEDIEVDLGIARLKSAPVKGQNIHNKGSDCPKGTVLLKAPRYISPADIGIMASVGKSHVKVKRVPRVAVISTGNELVDLDREPLPHQIRRSNAYVLYAALKEKGITPLLLHLADDKDIIRQKLAFATETMDVLLLSGGVSMGKFDFIPRVMDQLGVEKIFHGVRQRPGKPFWFGSHRTSDCLIFSFPGNPVSTTTNYFVYFHSWLLATMGLPPEETAVHLGETLEIPGSFTRLIQVRAQWEQGVLVAYPIVGNGSGDITTLSECDGVICLQPSEIPYAKGSVVPLVPIRKMI